MVPGHSVSAPGMSVQNGQFGPWLALNLLAGRATTPGEVLPVDFAGQADAPPPC
jgi:hypothetical protein